MSANLLTLASAREYVEEAGCVVADLNGDGPGFQIVCPICRATVTVTEAEDGPVKLVCEGGCGRSNIVVGLARSLPGLGAVGGVFAEEPDPPPATDELLDQVVAFMSRFVVLPSMASKRALALFVLHTWAFAAAYATPYIVIESPEKQSGKTRLLEVLALICCNPVRVASVSAAALYQTIQARKPTLLIDEADAIFGGHAERHEDLRGVLNAGNMPGSPVRRGGKDGEPVEFDVYCPKVIAGIATGKLPDTIRDRAIVIAIDRKMKSERVERLRVRKVTAEVDQLKESLRRWADAADDELREFDLDEPLESISDRLEEAWEPLLAIAEQAGGTWRDLARDTAQQLAAGTDDGEGDLAHVLLMALRELFKTGGDVISSQDVVTLLNAETEWPFAALRDGKGITTHQVAKLLRRYRIGPMKARPQGQDPVRGYRRESFSDAWERY